MPTGTDVLPVAVLIAAHNRAQWVGQAVASALGQIPRAPAEVIVIDDGSTDDTGAVARAAGARVIRHDTNRGAAAARNTGADATGQPWIAPLDSDDRWLPDMLDTLWPLRGRYGFVAGASLAVDEHDRPLVYGGPLAPEPIVLGSPAPLVFPENFVAASGVLICRETFLEVGGYRVGLRQAEDLDLWMRVLEVRAGLCVPHIVTLYRVHAGQKSRGGEQARDAVMEIIERHRDAAWWQEEIIERRRAVMAWDDLREALRAGDRRRVASQAWWLGGRLIRLRALGAALGRRREGRRRAAALAGPVSDRHPVS